MTVTRASTQRSTQHARTHTAHKSHKTHKAGAPKRASHARRTGHSTVDSFTPARRSAAAGPASAARTNRILDRLDPAHHFLATGRRGTPQRTTYCNQFAQAALRQMGVPTPGGNANSMNRYFNRQQDGWHAVSAAEAQRMANQGHAVVASWNNPTGGHGHIAIVRPGELGQGGPRIAQAGGTNFNNGSVARGFGRHTPQYFVHD
ncbi:MAG: hypothetical protein U0228_09015 [Myxococcaceae bacterium]